MRTIQNIVDDYINWIADIKANPSLKANKIFSGMEKKEEEQLRAVILKELNTRFYDPIDGDFYFFKFALGDLRYAPGVVRRPWRYNSLMKKWGLLLRSHKNLAIMCSRTLGKTTRISVAESLRRMYMFPNYRILIESAAQELVETEVIYKIQSIIETNELLLLKKSKNATWKRDRLQYNGGSVIGKGYGSAVRGLHVDEIVVDDILRKDNRMSNNQIKDFFYRELAPMVKDSRGQLILVGTPMNEDDLFADILEKSKDSKSDWSFFRFPAIIDYERKILQCPDRYTFEELMTERLNIGAWRFEVEYQVMFRPPSKGIFSETVLNVAYDKGRQRPFLIRGEEGIEYFIGVDVARGGSASADYTVFTCGHVDEKSKERVIDRVERYKGLKISQQVIRLVELTKKFNNATIIVEKNNMGQEMIDELVDNYGIPVETYYTAASGKSNRKEDLIRYMVQLFENELMIIPSGAEDEIASPGFTERDVSVQLRNELESFSVVATPAGNEAFKGVGNKDDMCMSLALFCVLTKQYAFDNFFAVEPEKQDFRKDSDIVTMIRMGLIK